MSLTFPIYPADVLEKAAAIKLFISDVDGVLTDGALFYASGQEHTKAFHVHDGYGIRLLQRNHIPFAIITAKNSVAVTQRMQELNVSDVFQGYSDKKLPYATLRERYQLADHEIAYIGDDLPDLVVLQQVGFAIAVKNAHFLVKQSVHWVTERAGGQGAVREAIDLILHAQNFFPQLLTTV